MELRKDASFQPVKLLGREVAHGGGCQSELWQNQGRKQDSGL
jgi:hypothetical protein